MNKETALKIQREIEAVCIKHGLWFNAIHENKPELRMIRIQEISIKIDEK